MVGDESERQVAKEDMLQWATEFIADCAAKQEALPLQESSH